MKARDHYCLMLVVYILIVLAIVLFAPSRGMAQSLNCAHFDAIRLLVTKTYRQSDIGGGRLTETAVLRIFAAADGATFSMVVVRPNGEACIVATGQGLDVTPPKPASERQG